jgi:hypothetical protein
MRSPSRLPHTPLHQPGQQVQAPQAASLQQPRSLRGGGRSDATSPRTNQPRLQHLQDPVCLFLDPVSLLTIQRPLPDVFSLSYPTTAHTVLLPYSFYEPHSPACCSTPPGSAWGETSPSSPSCSPSRGNHSQTTRTTSAEKPPRTLASFVCSTDLATFAKLLCTIMLAVVMSAGQVIGCRICISVSKRKIE